MMFARSLKIAFVFAACLLPLAKVSAEPAPLTFDSLWMMKRVGAPVVSPDGKQVVFPVVEPAFEAEKTVSDLWLVPSDGHAAPRRITNSKAPEEAVAWSPDSRSIAFTSKREGDEAAQVYILNLAEGGEARRLTSLSTGATNPKWRPDGKAILFESLVYPDTIDDEANAKITAEHKARKYNVRTYEHFPVRYWNQWLDERRPTLLIQETAPGSVARDILSPTALAHQSGFYGANEGDGGASLAPLWSPDGNEVLFTATTELWNSAFAHVGYRLYRMAAAGTGEPTRVTPAVGEYEEARFSPDGKALFFKYAPQDEEVYHLARLNRIAWPKGGAAQLVTRDFDAETSHYAISQDGSLAYLLVPHAGKESLYQVSSEGATPSLVIEPSTGGYTSLTIAEKSTKPVLIGRYGSAVRPLEIVRLDPLHHDHLALSDFGGAAAAAIDWAPPEHFTFTSDKGRPIHNMIVLPPKFDANKKYPLLVLIHGGAASNNADQIGLRWNYHLLAAPGYVVLMTDYTGSTSFGEKFAQAIKLDPLKTPGEEIDQAVDEALKRYPYIDGSHMCAAGASYGGHLANWIESTSTRYKCIISHAGEVDLAAQWGTSDFMYGRELANGGPPWEGNPIWHDQSPITYAGHWQTPMLLSIGERDFRVPINNVLQNFSALQRMKVPSRLLVWPDAWHWITKAEDSRHFYEEVHGWLATYLKE